MSWSKLPKAARKYILYHCYVTPLLFWWYVIPYIMLNKGLSVEETGLLYTLGMITSSIVNFLIGKWLDKGSPNLLMAIIAVFDVISYTIYFLAFSYGIKILILAAIAVEYIGRGFYPAYPVYEYEIYPEDAREKAFIYHYALPFLSQAVSYPIIGFILVKYFDTVDKLVYTVAFIALTSIIFILLPLYWLQKVEVTRIEKEEKEKAKIRFSGKLLLLALILIMLSVAYSLAPTFVLVNLFIENFGGGLFEIGVYESIVGFTMALFALPLLKVDKKHGKKLTIAGLLLIALAFIILGASKDFLLAFISAFLSSVGEAIMTPFYMDALFSQIPKELKGSIIGGIAGIRRVINLTTPFIAGILAGISPSLPYLISGLMIAVVALAYFISS